MGGVVAVEGFLAGAELVFIECVERFVDGVEKAVQVAVLGIDKQEPGDDLAGGMALLQIGQRRDAVGCRLPHRMEEKRANGAPGPGAPDLIAARCDSMPAGLANEKREGSPD